MAKDPSFPFYAQDYLVDTLRWSRGMKSLHVDLLAESWANGKIIDDNGAPAGLNTADRELWTKIVHKWKLVDGVWISEKLEEVRAARQNFKKLQSERGKKSAEKRNGKPTSVQPETNQRSTMVEPVESEYENEDEFKNKKESQSQNSTLITNPWDSDPAPDFTQPDVNGDTIIFPLDTKPVRELWASWKKYRWKKYGLQYGMFGEQAALKRLDGLTLPQIEETITAAIQAQWQNLYPEKSKSHGRKTKQQRNIETLAEGFATKYGNKSSPDSGGYSPF